jgi:hypothetical protein
VVEQVNRRGKIGPQGVLLLMAGMGHLLAPPLVQAAVRTAQRRDEEEARNRLLLVQGIDPAELERHNLAGSLGLLPPPRPVVGEWMEQLPEAKRAKYEMRPLAERKARRAKRKQRRQR